MEFLHARIHPPSEWLLRAQRPLMLVRCPRCRDPYVAEPPADAEPWERSEWEYQAKARLLIECPDHAHRFAVGE